MTIEESTAARTVEAAEIAKLESITDDGPGFQKLPLAGRMKIRRLLIARKRRLKAVVKIEGLMEQVGQSDREIVENTPTAEEMTPVEPENRG